MVLKKSINQDKYPINEVKYNFCISDSDTDIELVNYLKNQNY